MYCLLVSILTIGSFVFSAGYAQESGSRIVIKNFDPNLAQYDPYLRRFLTEDIAHPKYFLKLIGFPRERTLHLYIKRLVQEGEDWICKLELSIRKDGMLLNYDLPIGPYFYLSSRNFLPGERVHLRFETLEKDFIREVSFVPQPMVIKNTSNEKVMEAELKTLKPCLYAIQLHKFDKGELVTFESQSGNEKNAIEGTASSTFYSPDIEGEEGGIGAFTVARKNGEKFSMRFPWGDRLLDYLEGGKVYVP